jgi:uncharacterized tellurite resistance protein B-like protein
MGLLSRIAGMATGAKKAEDDELLLHAMLLMAGADGHIDEEEIAAVRAFAWTLPELKDADFGRVLAGAQKLARRYSTPQESVAALAELSSPALKMKAFVLVVDIALASGDIDDAEDAMLETMQRLLGVDDQSAQTIIRVLSMKYAK